MNMIKILNYQFIINLFKIFTQLCELVKAS